MRRVGANCRRGKFQMAEDFVSTGAEPGPTRLAYLDLMREIEDLLYLEADLVDERRYDQWLDLFTEDVNYWMPLRKSPRVIDLIK